MSFDPEDTQTRQAQLHDSLNVLPVSSEDLSLEPATQTEFMGTNSMAGSTILDLNSDKKRNDDHTLVSNRFSWSELPKLQDELSEFALMPAMIPGATLDLAEPQTTESSEYISEGKLEALVKAAGFLVERVGAPQHPEPLPRSQRQTMPEDPADPARSMRRKDAWEVGATQIPLPHDNWRRGDWKCFAPKGLVAPPSTPETYGVPDTKGRTQAAREAREKADQDFLDDAGDAGYTILGIVIYGLSAIGSMHDTNLTSVPVASSVY